MDQQAVIETLRSHEPALRLRGVTRAALFGSRARDDARPDSDIDVMIDIDPAAHATIYDLVGISRLIAGLFPMKVDVVERAGMKSPFRERVEREAVHVF